MFAVAVKAPNQIEIVQVPKPVPGAYQARIRTEAACLCNMTDRKLIEGQFPGVDQYPLLLGHETVGIVEEVGAKVRNFKVGDRVVGGLLLSPTDSAYGSGWGGFSEFTLAGDHAAMLQDGCATAEGGWFEVYEIMRVVPAHVSVEDAVMLCTWREVYGAFGDFNLKQGDDILIYGGGPVGLSFVKFARLLGLGEIYLVDRWAHKRDKAMSMGATAAFAPDDPALTALLQGKRGTLDAVIDAIGKEDIINNALPLVKMGGSVCVYGVIDTPSIHVDKSAAPFNFNLFIHQWPTRRLEHDAQEPLIEWIDAGKLSYREFLSAEYPIQDIAEAYQSAQVNKTVKTLLRY